MTTPRGATRAWIRDNTGHVGDACLPWPFARFPDGRAHMKGAKPARVMCELVRGPAPSSIHEAAHSCGKGHEACMNPQHLRWATPAENTADKIEHGTLIEGEGHYGAKLDADKVRAIRRLSASMTQSAIAVMFGVHLSCVNKVVNGKSWRSVA